MAQQTSLPFVHSAAQIHPGALIDATVEVGAFTVIGDGVQLGPCSRVGPQSVLGDWRGTARERDSTTICIGRGVEIGARVSVHGAVRIGDSVKIGNNVTLQGPLMIGDRTEIFDGAVIGAAGQFPGRHVTGGGVVIDNDVTIREFVAINQPVNSTRTRVGSHSYLMARSQVDHDCEIGEHVKLATGVTLGGAVTIDCYAYLGMNCVVHQGTHVGAHAMLGMNSAILKNIPPFAVVVGPRFTKVNSIGLLRRGFALEAVEEIEAFYTAAHTIDTTSLTRPAIKPSLQVIAEFYLRNAGKQILAPSFSASLRT